MNCINWSELAWDDVMPGMRRKVVHGVGLTMVLVDLAPHLELPVHGHPHEQALMLLSGGLNFSMADETRTIGPGDVVRILPGVDHGAKVGHQPTRLIDIFTPPRDEFPASMRKIDS
ncbi:MAG: cupin domain-containing protein [Desulfobacterales bacterium]